MGPINDQRKLTAFIWMMILCCLLQQLVQSSTVSQDSNYLVLKNNKVLALSLNNQIPEQPERQIQKLWISNNQEMLKIQAELQDKNNLNENYILNLTQYLPIFSSHLNQKGYIRPLASFVSSKHAKQFVKGYKYKKPAYHDATDETFGEVEAFLKALIEANNFNYLNLRMEDSFEIQIYIIESKQHPVINSIRIKYLFATVQKDSLPVETLYILSDSIQSYDQYLSRQKMGRIERKLSGRGLHQWVNFTVILDDVTDILVQSQRQKCFLQFTDVLPESTYIDADQRRRQTTNYETINIQKPAFAAKQYFYKYRVPWAQLEESGVHRYSYQQPIHFRYPSPSLLNITKVYLHPIEQARIVCGQSQAQNRQKQHSLLQTVYPLQQNLLFERGTAKIPNADISKSKIVSIVTLAVCLVTVLVIVNNLKKR